MHKLIVVLLFLPLYAFSFTTITVTYPVEQYFIEKIAQNKVYIRTIHLKHDKFSINDKVKINKLSNSKYYFTLDLPEEKKFYKLFLTKNSAMTLFDMSHSIEKMKIYGKVNPYIWLDPILVRDIAKNIYEMLVSIQVEDKEFFEENYKNFLNELDEFYLELRESILHSEVYGFLAYSDYWDYLASRFRLKVYKNEYRYLKIDEVSAFIRFARKENIKKIIIKKNISYEIAQSLAGHIGATIIEHNIFSHEWKSNLFLLVRKLSRSE